MKLMQQVLEASNKVNEGVFSNYDKKRGESNVARDYYKDALTYLDLLASGDVEGEKVVEIANKVRENLIAYGNQVHRITGKHPANR